MIGRRELERKLTKTFSMLAVRKNIITDIQQLLLSKHNMTFGTSSTYLTGIMPLSEASVEELVWLTNTTKQIVLETDYSRFVKDIDIEHYFGKNEIVSFTNSKVTTKNKETYPIVFPNVLKVNDDQWVCVVDANFLEELYRKQIINYNKNTQRNLTVKNVNGVDTFQITLKKKSVNEIADSLEKGLFIPNALTFNLNVDNPDVDFHFDGNDLTLNSGQADIIDGYHRFRAIMLVKSKNKEYNSPWILNLMNFYENKACTYIAQEDKRNKINRNFSKALDNTNLSNLVVNRLNEDNASYLYGQIGKQNGSPIESTQLFNLIDFCFNVKERAEVLNVTKFLKKIFNTLIEDDNSLLENINFKKLAIIIRSASIIYYNNTDDNMIIQIIKHADEISDVKFKRQSVNKSVFSEIDERLRRYGLNV